MAIIVRNCDVPWLDESIDSLRTRLDPSDIVQEAQLEALTRLPSYLVRQPMPFRAWLYHTAIQRMLKLREHARCRTPRPWP